MLHRSAPAAWPVAGNRTPDRPRTELNVIQPLCVKWFVGKLCLLAGVASTLLLGAAPPELMPLLDRVEKRYNQIGTLQVAFEQQYRQPGRAPRSERGVLSLRKPGRMRWEYTSPEGKLFITDGKTVWFYSPSAAVVEKSKMKESGDLRTPLAFLVGKLDFRRDFSTFRTRSEGTDLLVVATPKSKNAPFTEVTFTVSPQAEIRSLSVQGLDQSVMVFRFDREKRNVVLPDSLFRFRVPPGVEVVEAMDGGGEAR